jgi:hypothetical protein
MGIILFQVNGLLTLRLAKKQNSQTGNAYVVENFKKKLRLLSTISVNIVTKDFECKSTNGDIVQKNVEQHNRIRKARKVYHSHHPKNWHEKVTIMASKCKK